MKKPSFFVGQNLFIKGEDWQSNAMLGWTNFPLDIYATGYKDAADLIRNALTNRNSYLDTAIYPLIFLYRQGLELQLKLILPLARRLTGKIASLDHEHRLTPLWTELNIILIELNSQPEDKELAAIGHFIAQIEKVDPISFAFRYPTTKKGEVSLPDLDYVNVRHLGEIMDSVFMMLGGIHSWLGEMDQKGSN